MAFPGESDEDFEHTMTLLEEVRFEGSFSFKYSPRPGTPALRLKDPEVDPAVAQERLMRFQKRQQEIQLDVHHGMIGQVHDVLVEGPSKWEEKVMAGRTGTFKTVNFEGSADLVGQTVPVRILRGFTNSLRGELVEAGA